MAERGAGRGSPHDPSAMTLLAIETASAACSAALIAGDRVIAARREIVGRGHAERLVPMVDELLAEAGGVTPAGILVGCGPGSFTGVRVGLAAAIGMGIGWGVQVSGMSATALIAAALFAGDDAIEGCAVAIAGGHGELFVERFARRPFVPASPLASLEPAAAAAAGPDEVVAGSGAAALVAARGWGRALDSLPDARDARLLPPALRLPARPIYGRAPDARVAA